MLDSQVARWLAQQILPHEPALRRWLARHLPHDLALDDVVQETYARLVRVSDSAAITNAKAYFFQAARSVVLMHLRRARIVRIEAVADIRDSLADHAPPVDETVLWREQLELYLGHVAQMPEKARAAFELRFHEGLSFAEIAQRLDMTENAAQKNVARNLQILARRMAEGGFRVNEASIAGTPSGMAKSARSAE